MGTENRFVQLAEYFKESDTVEAGEGLLAFRTKVGVFCPAQLTHIEQGVSILIEGGVISRQDLFVDAGSGDGRVLAVTALHGIPSLGVEYDAGLVNKAIRHIQKLQRESILNSTPVRFIQGDFTDDRTYAQAGVRFSEIPVFFNFINNFRDLAEKIRKDSQNGAKLLLYDLCPEPPELSGLGLRRTITLSNPKDEERFRGTGDDSYKNFLYVYEK